MRFRLLSSRLTPVLRSIVCCCIVAFSFTPPPASANTSSTRILGAPLTCSGLRYAVLRQNIGNAINQISYACGFTAMVGQGLNQPARPGTYSGDLSSALLILNNQQALHWGRINNTLYADDAARSGSASIELRAMTRAAFEQTLSNNRISISESQVTYDNANNIYRIAGPITFVTDLEQTLSNVRARATASTGPNTGIADIKVIKFGIITRAAN